MKVFVAFCEILMSLNSRNGNYKSNTEDHILTNIIAIFPIICNWIQIIRSAVKSA
jgi:hypothetical protein